MAVKVSVVIPTYNSAQWVEATLDSVIRQTYPAELIEIIVVDDKSPDDSAGVARRFLEKHAPGRSLVVAHEQNRGVPANRNSGLRIATGDWIQFLDADDLLAPHKIELQAQAAERVGSDIAVVTTNWQHFEQIGGAWQPTGLINTPYIDDAPIERILNDLNFGFVGPTLIRKAFLEKVGGFVEQPNIGEDCDLMMRLAMSGGGFRSAPSQTAAFLYRQSPNSLWRNYIKNVVPMRNALHTFRNVEHFLRAKDPRGQLSNDARVGLARRYSRWHDFFLVYDPESFSNLIEWLRALGYHCPHGTRWALRLLSSVVGYEKAIQIRTDLRKKVNRTTASRAALVLSVGALAQWNVLADWSVLADVLL
jgi:glycosyltransferase involved in cell wall biosynthesis